MHDQYPIIACMLNACYPLLYSLRHIEFLICCQTSNIKRTLVGNKIVGHSDIVGASPAGTAPTTSSFST